MRRVLSLLARPLQRRRKGRRRQLDDLEAFTEIIDEELARVTKVAAR